MDRMVVTAFVLLLATCYTARVAGETCYSTDKYPYRLFGWKTNYDAEPRVNTDTLEVANCQPLMVYYIGRHGSRYPAKTSIEKMELQLPGLQKQIVDSKNGTICAADISGIKHWTLRMNQSLAQILVETGEREHYDIAGRFKKRLASLFNTTYDKNKFKISHTETQRTKFSAKYFARGLFGKDFYDDSFDAELVLEQKPKNEDYLLRYYSLCDNWQKKVYKVPVTEQGVFDQSDAMKDVLSSVSKRLGLNKTLDFSSLESIYKMCAYDHIIFGVPDSKDPIPRNQSGSPWCAAFTRDELEALEYRSDIIDYYYASYGNSINPKTTCPLTKDIAKFLKLAKEGSPNAQKGVLRFGHSYTLMTTQTRLGLFKDESPIAPLKGSDYKGKKQTLSNRRFRSSRNIPMATGIGIFAFKCGSDFKFKLTINEEEQKIFGCSETLCDLDVLMKELEKPCDYEEICEGKISGAIARSYELSTLVFACLFIILVKLRVQ